MADIGERQELTAEEIAELDAMDGGSVLRDPETGAIIQEDGSFDYSEAPPAGPADDGYGLDEFLDDADQTVGLIERGVDTVAEVGDILDGDDDTPPAPRPRGGTRTVSNETEAETEEPPADAAPSLMGWESFGVDTDGNLYLPFGIVIPWYWALVILGALYIAYEVFVWLFFTPKSKKKKWF